MSNNSSNPQPATRVSRQTNFPLAIAIGQTTPEPETRNPQLETRHSELNNTITIFVT